MDEAPEEEEKSSGTVGKHREGARRDAAAQPERFTGGGAAVSPAQAPSPPGGSAAESPAFH